MISRKVLSLYVLEKKAVVPGELLYGDIQEARNSAETRYWTTKLSYLGYLERQHPGSQEQC
jgi:hypothetical protein